MAYSEQEIKAFAEKDRRIVRQSSLKVAADIVLSIEDIVTETTVLKVKEVAQELTNWVYEKAADGCIGKCEKPNDTQQLPVPTLAQRKVLDAIQDKTGMNWDVLCTWVLKWAEAVYNNRAYPTKLESVEAFLAWNNK